MAEKKTNTSSESERRMEKNLGKKKIVGNCHCRLLYG